MSPNSGDNWLVSYAISFFLIDWFLMLFHIGDICFFYLMLSMVFNLCWAKVIFLILENDFF